MLLIALSIVPAIVVSFVTQYLIFRSSTNYTAGLSSQVVKYIASEIDNYLLGINESLNTFVIDSEFQKFLEVPKDHIPMQAGYAINFRPMLQLMAQSKKEIQGVLYLDRLGKVYSESQKFNIDIAYPFNEDPHIGKVFKMTSEGLIGPHDQNYAILFSRRKVVSFVKPVKHIRLKKIVAWLMVEIDALWFRSLLEKHQFGENGQALLYSLTEENIVMPVERNPLYDKLERELRQRKQPSGQFMISGGGETYQIMYDTVPLANWRFVGVIPLANMTEGVRQAQWLTGAVAVISVFLSLIVAFPLMSVVLKPLYLLKRGMQLLGRGSSVPIRHHSQDEIGFLIKTYNRMLSDLENLRQEVIKTKLKEKEKELLQLQAQINPHFLFNTLETIESYSMHNNGEAVSDMLQCVSRMLRYNVRNDGGRAPLKEELEYIRHFLNIHYYRNEKRIRTEFFIDEELMNISVMKLSLQPLVENSLKYGWNPQMGHDDFILTVTAKRDGGKLVFTVADTGMGIPDDKLAVLQKLFASGGETDDPFFRRHTGLLNVYRRYVLAYGDNFQMRIERNERAGKGTIVTVIKPFEKPETGG